MAKSRQNNLFAAEDWKIAYKAYSEVNYQAYDFDTMRGAMVDYVRTNFPENFNDYIESSEFIAIIELLAYLSQSLAFRMDINTRENFLETAERKDSVFKLARMLGYNPKRNIPASGLMKVTSVKTSEELIDSNGVNLSNKIIFWDDANNSNNYEQFITVLNSSMSTTNRFSSPIKSGSINNIKTELYQLNTPTNSPITYNNGVSIGGGTKQINIVNPEFKDNSHFYERHPDPSNSFNLIYRNDGKGNSSNDTGFFVMFRQGQLQFTDFNFTTPVESRVQDITVSNINESDVYLQEVNTGGRVLNKWTKIPNTVGQTLNYNSQSLNTRNLYSVENIGDSNGIRLRFPDGEFGNVPTGIYRAWYRSSDPSRYTISPEEARNLSIVVPYVNAAGKEQKLTVTYSLQYKIGNSSPAESLAAIKDRAPKTFYTQNRMVSAQDYNVFPETQSGNITKVKSINRTHSGHSRYIDINDPTGTYHNIDTFADDAFIYSNNSNHTQDVIVNDSTTALEVVSSIIPNALKDRKVNNFVYYRMRNAWTNPTTGGAYANFRYETQNQIVWNPLPLTSTSKSGYISEQFTDGNRNVLVNTLSSTSMFKENTFLKFVNPADSIGGYKWVRIVNIENNGALSAGLSTSIGPITLSEEVNSLWEVREVIISMRKLFSTGEISGASGFETAIKNRETFGIGYNLLTDSWYKIPSTELTTASKTGSYSLNSTNAGPNSWVILMEYSAIDINNYKYKMTIRGNEYVVQSESDLKFYNVKSVKTLGSDNKSNKDTIIITSTNTKPGNSETFEWSGIKWQNTEVGLEIEPIGLAINIPLRTRDTKATDVDTQWVSNFGIMEKSGTTVADQVAYNRYVEEAVVTLNTYHQVGGITSETNVVIANNMGTIQSLPSKISISFNNTTFGSNFVDTSEAIPYIVYRQVPNEGSPGQEKIFKANAQIVTASGVSGTGSGTDDTVKSWGTDGTAQDGSPSLGRLFLKSYDTVTGVGRLEYTRVQNGDYHFSRDGTANPPYRDKLTIHYENSKEKLDQPIEWEVVDSFKETDGYTDNRKVIVAPLDTDNDLVPDRPIQFLEYVDATDYVFFEYYTDFDGYKYDKPCSGIIHDFRREDSLSINDTRDTVSPTSYKKDVKLSTSKWIVVKNKTVALQFENLVNSKGLIVTTADDMKTYQLTPLSTAITQIKLSETTDYFVRNGRGKTQDTSAPFMAPGTIRWNHVAPSDVRIDPSISNIVEMVVLTTSYHTQVKEWQVRPVGTFPLEPTSDQLATEFTELNQYKSASDSLVYRSAKFKLLFGPTADEVNQARFKIIKLSDQISDNELKASVITAINTYFDVSNWEFGENFYFTELSSYIHQKLGSNIGSIVILPKNTAGKFGEMFQIKAEPNELFVSTATVSDIEIVSRLDNQTLGS
tara:strand:+ start:2324 stop:6538 length:4215 start_codon:yes stop_codon:yes gene_type:complete